MSGRGGETCMAWVLHKSKKVVVVIEKSIALIKYIRVIRIAR